jgi:hypothetical protein
MEFGFEVLVGTSQSLRSYTDWTRSQTSSFARMFLCQHADEFEESQGQSRWRVSQSRARSPHERSDMLGIIKHNSRMLRSLSLGGAYAPTRWLIRATLAAIKAVIPAKAGIQYPAPSRSITSASEYWVARSSRAMTAEIFSSLRTRRVARVRLRRNRHPGIVTADYAGAHPPHGIRADILSGRAMRPWS